MEKRASTFIVTLSTLYSFCITGFSILVALLMLGSSHRLESMEPDFLLVAGSSLLIMPVTAILLYRSLLRENAELSSPYSLIVLLVLVMLIFTYYFYEAVTDEYSEGLSMFHMVPLAAIVATVLLIVTVLKLMNNLR